MLARLRNFTCDFQPWRRSDGKVFETPFAFDVETPKIVTHEVPPYVLGAASDGKRGVFLPPSQTCDFFEAHADLDVIFHHCAFDLAVLDRLLKSQGGLMDIYDLVDSQRVWDTQLLHRLCTLATDGHTCQGRGQSTLDTCAERYLGVTLPKSGLDADGDELRMSWGKWHGRPAKDIPDVYLDYLAKDVLATFGCWEDLMRRLGEVFKHSHEAWGFVDYAWLESQIDRYGPQTHDLQVKAAIALDAVERVGIALDMTNRNDMVSALQKQHSDLRESLRVHGYLDGEEGCQKALQALARQALQTHPGIDVARTPRTGAVSFKDEDLDALAEVSDFFAAYKEFKQVRMLLNNYLVKMDSTRIHPHYGVLKTTGRTSSTNPNIQGFPRKKKKTARSILTFGAVSLQPKAKSST